MDENSFKLSNLRNLLFQHGLEGILLRKASSFSWLTGGLSSVINTASSFGEASLLITQEHSYLITTSIEAPRFLQEDRVEDQGWQVIVQDWYSSESPMKKIVQGGRLGSDFPMPGFTDLSLEIAQLRSILSPEEQNRLREVASLCAFAMEETAFAVRPGMSEYEISALLARACINRGVEPIVRLIATDERIFHYRHPPATSKSLQRYAMLVLCGRKYGLVVSLTRLIHFGKLPDEIQRKARATAYVDAIALSSTRPGRTLGDVFKDITLAYEIAGYPDEWKLHHQGGPAGYEPREWIATPESQQRVVEGQAYAWNPSITGTKSEDTILVKEGGFEILTDIPDWPTLDIEVSGNLIRRPAILEV